jgi:polyisoprenoid-binding protein YceI
MIRLFSFVIFLSLSAFTIIGDTTETWMADISQSTLSWVGKKTVGEHSGFIKLKSGQLNLKGGEIVSGSFIVDMNSIVCADSKEETKNAKLITHLTSDDFFSVEKYPTAEFTITEVSYKKSPAYPDDIHIVKGALTIKGVTKTIECMAKVHKSETNILVSGSISIDGTLWGITNKSANVFPELEDKIIDDIFVLKFEIDAIKQ